MRLSNSQAVARPLPPDRNGVGVTKSSWLFNTAPHADTIRWAYTVAIGKKAKINGLTNTMGRQTVATAAGAYQAYIGYTPSGGSLNIMFMELGNGNVVERISGTNIGTYGDMLSGDKLDAHTLDVSTAGTVNYMQSASAMEYAA